MSSIHQILKKYWGYDNFRPLQEDIIVSTLNKNDTLALLPTGGGKSICFQVPALAMEGLCLVVSPLIALMKDQVENLQKKGIRAIAITSAMSFREIDIALDNAIHGNFKFLYISPERLHNELFLARLSKMNVSLLAIDEAHCISQWGYDFRPSYLRIAEIREKLPNVPVLALTATATPEVVKDIQEKLHFKKENVLQKSFERKNLAYIVLYEEDKLNRLISICNKIPGTAVVYARNRKKTQEIALFLRKNNISADYYHAGLSALERNKKQEEWINNKTRIMVATNAFGMGIDKPDVRFVVHMDLPDNLEAYFQEAGRGGRDEKKAYGILLYSLNDRLELERNFENSFPTIEQIRNTYQAICNYFQLAIGAGEGISFDFDIHEVCTRYNLNPLTVFNSLKFLEREGYLATSESVYHSSKIHIKVNKEDLYKFEVANRVYEPIIKLLLRSYGGLFDYFVPINEQEIAQRLKTEKSIVVKQLEELKKLDILDYEASTDLPQITFLQERKDASKLHISPENYSLLKERAKKRMEWVLHYTESRHLCRSRILLSYFGEHNAQDCGQCDVCIEKKKSGLTQKQFDEIYNEIIQLLSTINVTPSDLKDKLSKFQESEYLKVLQFMIEQNMIKLNNEGKYQLIH
ncbi:MAG: ATP-dependent DNA helicase RecQ [Bacteroidia bacterium]